VWTGTVGAGADQQFVIEWRNMLLYAAGDPRVSYEVIFSPRGDITFNYSGLITDDSKGANAAVGITSPGGGFGLQYLFQEPALVSGTAITFPYPADPQPIPYGSVSGTMSENGAPFANARVTLDDTRTTTDNAGHYRFDSLEAGTYRLEGSSGCDGATVANLNIDGDVTMDLDTAPIVDDFGYSCVLGTSSWIPVETVLPKSYGDVELPFAFPFYGRTYTAASVGAGGVYLRDPNDSTTGGDIEFFPGANVNPDAQSTVRVGSVGTAPNRQFVVEARNVPLLEVPAVRVTLEIVLSENGTVSMNFLDPPDPSLLPNPITIWFYSLTNGLITYLEDGRGLLSRNAVFFRPPAS
jgi:hypothetical protein